MTTNTQQLTAEINDADFAALTNAARDLAPSDIIGLPLKFNKGKWLIKLSKDEQHEVTATESFVVDPISYAEGWYKWVNQKPVFKAIGRRVDGFISPPRSVLPDQDKRLWPVDTKGPKDPWQERQHLLLKDLTSGELLTWINEGSWGGRRGLGEFLDAYVAEIKKHPGEDPIVLLQSWERPSQDWGNIPTPRLKLVGWQPFGEGRTPPGDPARAKLMREALQDLLAPPKPDAALTALAAPQAEVAVLEDDIPF
jgi:hypothetical protein